jgi:hypothetical protein
MPWSECSAIDSAGQRDVGGEVGDQEVRAEQRRHELDRGRMLDQLAEDRVTLQQIEDADIMLIGIEPDLACRHAKPLALLGGGPQTLADAPDLRRGEHTGHDAASLVEQLAFLGVDIHSSLHVRQATCR